MIVLDTNILSAVMRSEPDPIVPAWLDRQPAESIWITTITVFEIRFGLELLPESRRRLQLEDAFERVLDEDLNGRILPFDFPAAEAAGRLAAQRRNSGRSVGVRDTQIAGIVIARHAALATHNVRDFGDLSVEVIDPWAAG